MIFCSRCGADTGATNIEDVTNVFDGKPYCSRRCCELLYEHGEEQFVLQLREGGA